MDGGGGGLRMRQMWMWGINPRRHKVKKVTRRHRGGESIGPLPSTFDTIQPID